PFHVARPSKDCEKKFGDCVYGELLFDSKIVHVMITWFGSFGSVAMNSLSSDWNGFPKLSWISPTGVFAYSSNEPRSAVSGEWRNEALRPAFDRSIHSPVFASLRKSNPSSA